MKNKRLIISIILTVLLSAILHYIVCPPINLHSKSFWGWIFATLVILFISLLMTTQTSVKVSKRELKRHSSDMISYMGASYSNSTKAMKVSTLSMLGLVALFLLGLLISSRLLHAKSYSQILQVEEGTTADIPSVEQTDAIALMDTDSARMLGDRKIGSLSQVVSQYELWDSDYTQINRQNHPVKVAPLSYGSFFKWLHNRASGVPGYVTVDPVSMEADYVKLEEGLHITPSAFFHEDLVRYIHFHYPTVIFEEPHFEVDEEGSPWYVAPIVDYSIGLFGGKRISGIILVDPIHGNMSRYALADVPEWVDVVIPGNLICTQYNDYAQLQQGFWNSIIGQVGCREVTSAPSTEEEDVYLTDFGYIAKDNDIYIYTGITSVNGDASNIGFIMSNERTGHTIFIEAPGANEFSAMSAAEGEVQEKGYQASFPSLISMDGVPTYIMVLKDKTGLVKMYACVNVEQYNMVVTAANQTDCIEKYRALLRGTISQDEANDDSIHVEPEETDLSTYEKTTVTVAKLQTIDRGGDTYLYLVDTEDHIYYAKYTDVIDMLLVGEGDTIDIYVKGETFRYIRG